MIGLLALAAALASDPDEVLAEGRRLLAVRDGPGAEAALRRCVDEHPEAALCWWELGWAHWIQREWPETVDCWEKVRALDPGHPDVRSALSRAKDNLALAELAQQGALAAPASFASAAPEGATLRLRAVGDIMLGSSFPDGYLPPDDGQGLLAAVDGLLADADLTFANLEGPLCDSGVTTKCNPRKPPGSCYAFRSPTRYGGYLREAGLDVVSTANNHAGDFGDPCREETERTLDGLGIAHTGRPADVASLIAQGLKVAVIGFHASAATHDVRDIPTARALVRGLAATHDLVVVSFHGGAEGAQALHVPAGSETYLDEDRGDLRAFAHAVVEEGADLVIGHGPHVLRGMEVHEGRLIAYSLGNFATYGRFNLSGNLGIGAVLEVVLDRDGAFLGGRLLPTRQEGEGIPVPDDAGRAIDLVRQLSGEDFPGTAVRVAQDGSLAAPAR
jgi:poly-gamma-glutamate capsule biosynthesis protein CapA/YwtB (metallophosphatase superfamily)